MLPADDRREQDDAAGDGPRDEVARARLGEEHRAARVHAERAVPLLGRHLEERRRRQRAGRVDEDVEPTVAREDVCDERLGALDLGEIRGWAEAAGPRRSTAGSSSPSGRSTHATSRSRRRRTPRRKRSRCPRCAPVTSATRPSSRHVPGGTRRPHSPERDDRVDLDRHVERQMRNTDRRARRETVGAVEVERPDPRSR